MSKINITIQQAALAGVEKTLATAAQSLSLAPIASIQALQPATDEAMAALLERQADICFCSTYGRFRGRAKRGMKSSCS